MAAAQREVWPLRSCARCSRSGLHLSSASVSALFAKQPAQVKLETLVALCTVLECAPIDLFEVDTAGDHHRQSGENEDRTQGGSRPLDAPAVTGYPACVECGAPLAAMAHMAAVLCQPARGAAVRSALPHPARRGNVGRARRLPMPSQSAAHAQPSRHRHRRHPNPWHACRRPLPDPSTRGTTPAWSATSPITSTTIDSSGPSVEHPEKGVLLAV
jgi:DNA-binding Xre family transcriptional regulator